MISHKDSIPTRSRKYLQGQDILWTQFNEINFYVEDEGTENFYYQILKKLFPDIKFERIFPLGGKDPVIKEAKRNFNNKKNIYLLDLDFDKILNKKINQENIFYLDRYSIENYVIEKNSIHEFIKEDLTKILDKDIESKFKIDTFTKEAQCILKDLIFNFYIIQKFDLRVEYFKLNPARDCINNDNILEIKNEYLNPFFKEVVETLKTKNKRIKIESQAKKANSLFSKTDLVLYNYPGKYLLLVLKHKLEKTFHLKQINLESFTYRLAKNSDLITLHPIRDKIQSYISS
jgi:hypothetical protein